MEDALREVTGDDGKFFLLRLNPCSNGRCSASNRPLDVVKSPRTVLILVLMEDALRDIAGLVLLSWMREVLILVLMEDALRAGSCSI